MKKVLLFSILLCANLLILSAQEPVITRSFRASSINAVEATTSGGSITVIGNAGSEAVVEVYASRNNWSAEKIQQTLDENYTIEVKVQNGKLIAEAKPKIKNLNWNRNGLSISFKISVPRQMNSNLQTSRG